MLFHYYGCTVIIYLLQAHNMADRATVFSTGIEIRWGVIYEMDCKFFKMTSYFETYLRPVTYRIKINTCFHLLLGGDSDLGKGYSRLSTTAEHGISLWYGMARIGHEFVLF